MIPRTEEKTVARELFEALEEVGARYVGTAAGKVAAADWSLGVGRLVTQRTRWLVRPARGEPDGRLAELCMSDEGCARLSIFPCYAER